MALGDDYITAEALKDRLDIADAVDDADLQAAVTAASRGIEHFCRRQFNQAASATARTYRPLSSELVIVDDFHTEAGLEVAVDEAGDGTFSTVWDPEDYELSPADGVVDGVEGFPFWRIRAVGSSGFPCNRRRSVRVTTPWGWAAAPGQVTEAAYIIGQDIARLKDTAFGVGGFSEFGRIRARENPHAAMQLMPYRRDAVRVR